MEFIGSTSEFFSENANMPDAVYVRPMMGVQPQSGHTHSSGPWSLDDPYGNATKYVRGDALTAMTADRDRLQAIVDNVTQGVRVDKA